MRRSQTDPVQLSGDDLDRWYRRTGSQIAAEREERRADRYRAFFTVTGQEHPSGQEAADPEGAHESQGWIDARVLVRPSAPVVAPTVPSAPRGARVAAPPPVAGVPNTAPRGGFFDKYRAIPNPALGPIYITDLPSPLNAVTPKVGGWFQLSDGTLVRNVDELERVYAEQQRRMRGEEEVEPPAWVHAADRLKDGAIPQVSEIAKGERELDATCHPNGGWERDAGFARYAPWTQSYETQIGRAPGLDYVVRNPGAKPVRFDGCAVWDPAHPLLEAKGPGYDGLLRRAGRSWFLGLLLNGLGSQAKRQSDAALGKDIEWHVAEPQAVPSFQGVTAPYPTIEVVQTSPR